MKKTLVYSQIIHTAWHRKLLLGLMKKSVDSHIWDNLVPIILRTTISIPTLTVVSMPRKRIQLNLFATHRLEIWYIYLKPTYMYSM